MKKVMCFVLAMIMLMPLTAFAANDNTVTVTLDGIDTTRGTNQLVAYTSGESTGTEDKPNCVEAVIDKNGNVLSVGGNNNTIPNGGFVLSGAGSKTTWIKNNIKVGYKVMLDKDSLTVMVVKDDKNIFRSTVLKYTGINSVRAENTCIIYRGKATTGTNTWGYEVVVNSDGVITSVGGNNNVIPEGGFVISAIGSYKQPLTDAAEIGMSVTLDEASKSITIGLDKSGAIKKAEILLGEYKSKLSAAKQNYLCIDYAACETELSALASHAEEIKSALEKDDMSAYLMASYLFDLTSSRLDDMLYEIPAVEERCLWVRPSKFSESEVKSAVKQIYDLGFNSIAIELLFDNTLYFPAPEGSLFEQNPSCRGKDLLKVWIDECHSRGIAVYGWMSSLRVAHSASGNVSAAVAAKKPEWKIKGSDGRDHFQQGDIKHYYLNVALPEVREFLSGTYRYIVSEYDLDGFQLDYIRYPDATDSGIYYGYDDTTLSLFSEKTGLDATKLTKGSADWTKWCQFKSDLVTDFVIEIENMIHEIKPEMYVSAAVAPQYEEGVAKKHQDVTRWLSEGLIDTVFPMSYGTTDAVKKWTGITLSTAKDGVSAFMGIRDGGYDTVRETILAVRDTYADGVAFFSYSQYLEGGYVGKIESTVFRERSVSPIYSPAAALKAQLERMYKRGKEVMKDESLNTSLEKINSAISRLEEESLTDVKADALAAMDEYLAAAKGSSEDMGRAAETDIERAKRIISISRRDGVATIQTPPEVDISEVTSEPDVSEPDNNTSEAVSDDTLSEEESAGSGIFGDATGFDKVMICLMVGIISFAALCAPLYVVLDMKKKRQKREQESEENKK